MDLLNIMQNRRSVRKYTSEPIGKEKLEKIIQAGLLSASGRALRPWELILVTDKETLQKLSDCRVGAAKMLEGAGAAIVVIGNPHKADTWIEDCSVVMANMHLMADSLGLGSCWIQGRMRNAATEQTTDEYVRDIIGYPQEFNLEAILSIGVADTHPEEYTLEELPMEKVHYERYCERD